MYQNIRHLINEKIKEKGYSISGFCASKMGIHINSWTRKWNRETVQLKDLIQVAKALDLVLSIGLYTKINNQYVGDWIQLKPDGQIKRIDEIKLEKEPKDWLQEIQEREYDYGDMVKANKELSEMNTRLMETILKMREKKD